jgi:hypothetical protein
MTRETNHICAVVLILEEAAADHGHVFLRRRLLSAFLKLRFGITDGAAAISAAQSAGHIVVRGDRVYLKHLDEAEQAVAEGVKRMLARQPNN